MKSGKTKTVTFFLAQLCTDRTPRLSHEHCDYRWVDKDEAIALYDIVFADMFNEFEHKISRNHLG